MQRKVFDKLASGVGAVLVVILLVAGGLLTWGHSFSNSNVHDQLAQQQIFFPTKAEVEAGGSEYTPAQAAALKANAGKQVLTGKQAQIYANDYIGAHLYAMPQHGVYSKISTAQRAATPGSAQATQLTALKETSFQGTTLRGMLLTAYAFGTIATIMFWASIAAWVGAAVLLVLTVLGFMHSSRTSGEERMFEGKKEEKPQETVGTASR